MAKVYEVTLFEDGRLVTVRVKARGSGEAKRRAEALCPDAAYLTTTQIFHSGTQLPTGGVMTVKQAKAIGAAIGALTEIGSHHGGRSFTDRATPADGRLAGTAGVAQETLTALLITAKVYDGCGAAGAVLAARLHRPTPDHERPNP
jgi:hypothetical protein